MAYSKVVMVEKAGWLRRCMAPVLSLRVYINKKPRYSSIKGLLFPLYESDWVPCQVGKMGCPTQ